MAPMTDALADPHHRPHVTPSPGGGPRDIVILGSTGSVGTQAIDVVLRNPDRFQVVAISAAGGRVELLAEQARTLGVRTVAVADPAAVAPLREALGRRYGTDRLPEILAGPDAATEAAALECHSVLNGITGSIGLRPTLAALEAGRVLVLANKESLIVGGPLVKALARPGQVIPVDSEHSALFQALLGGSHGEVRKLIVTASGGPFRGRTRTELEAVTVEQALAHPTWDMGPVITINSATLVNKGLEVIEAHLLYDIPFDRIEVVVHPQSYVHSMVEFSDGSTLAQASPPICGCRSPSALAGPTGCRAPPPPSTGPRRQHGSSSRSTTTRSRRSRWPAMSVASEAPRQRCSTRPTRNASKPSVPAGCRSPGSWTPSPGWSRNTERPPRELD